MLGHVQIISMSLHHERTLNGKLIAKKPLLSNYTKVGRFITVVLIFFWYARSCILVMFELLKWYDLPLNRKTLLESKIENVLQKLNPTI